MSAETKKVIVPKEVAKELEQMSPFIDIRSLAEISNDRIKYRNTFEWVNPQFNDNARENLRTLLDALTYGYKVEKTKEEQLKEFVESKGRVTESAVLKVLEIYEIKVKGVNA